MGALASHVFLQWSTKQSVCISVSNLHPLWVHFTFESSWIPVHCSLCSNNRAASPLENLGTKHVWQTCRHSPWFNLLLRRFFGFGNFSSLDFCAKVTFSKSKLTWRTRSSLRKRTLWLPRSSVLGFSLPCFCYKNLKIAEIFQPLASESTNFSNFLVPFSLEMRSPTFQLSCSSFLNWVSFEFSSFSVYFI